MNPNRRGIASCATIFSLLPYVQSSSCLDRSHDLMTLLSGGYRISNGKSHPICWISKLNENNTATPLSDDRDVVPSWDISERAALLSSCPTGTRLKVWNLDPSVHEEEGQAIRGQEGGRILQVDKVYHFRMEATLNLESFQGNPDVTSVDVHSDGNHSSSTLSSSMDDTALARVTLYIMLCDVEKVSLCTPLISHGNQEEILRNKTEDPLFSSLSKIEPSVVTRSEILLVKIDATKTVQDIEADIPLVLNREGTFNAIAVVQLFARNNTDGIPFISRFKYYMSNSLNGTDRLLRFRHNPVILKVEGPVKTTIECIMGIAVFAQSFLLISTIKHSGSSIMKLSQVSFIIVLLIAGIFATLSSLLFNPRNDLLCNLEMPMLLIPLQLMFAIIFARLWRTHSVISPILFGSMNKERGVLDRFVDSLLGATIVPFTKKRLCICRLTQENKNGRKVLTEHDVVKVIILLALPQVIVQVFSLVFEWQKLTIQYNEDASIGREICASNGVSLFSRLGLGIFVALLVTVLAMAYWSRFLPSVLNETLTMFNGGIVSLIVTLLSVAVIEATDAPTTSPTVRYLLVVAMTTCLTTNASARIVIPKLMVVWSRESVPVSKLMGDHQQFLKSGILQDNKMSSVQREIDAKVPNQDDGNIANLPTPLHRNGVINVSSISIDMEHENSQPKSNLYSNFHHTRRSLDNKFADTTCNGSPIKKPMKSDEGDDPIVDPVTEHRELRRETSKKERKSFTCSGSLASVFSSSTWKKEQENAPAKTEDNDVVMNEFEPEKRLSLETNDIMHKISHRALLGLSIPKEEWDALENTLGEVAGVMNQNG